MKVLLTGPSGAGKTTLSEQLGADVVVHLDRDAALPGLHSFRCASMSQVALFEGIPCGSDRDVAEFVASMDEILLLDAHSLWRVARCWRRDGPSGLWLWFRNEWFWRRVTKKILLRHASLRRVTWMPGWCFATLLAGQWP